MSRDSSLEILRVPYVGLHQTVFLSALEDGTLSLVAGDLLSYSAWRVDGRGASAQFIGFTAALGTVLDAPVMGDDHLYLPVQRGLDQVQDELPSTAFSGSGACTGL
jgi:hypothetical protein